MCVALISIIIILLYARHACLYIAYNVYVHSWLYSIAGSHIYSQIWLPQPLKTLWMACIRWYTCNHIHTSRHTHLAIIIIQCIDTYGGVITVLYITECLQLACQTYSHHDLWTVSRTTSSRRHREARLQVHSLTAYNIVNDVHTYMTSHEITVLVSVRIIW